MMPTETSRHTYRRNGKFAKAPQGSPDAGPDALARSVRWDFRDATDMPPPPEAWPRKKAEPLDWALFNAMHEPLERETWADWQGWLVSVTLLAAGTVAFALFVAVVVQFVFGFSLAEWLA